MSGRKGGREECVFSLRPNLHPGVTCPFHFGLSAAALFEVSWGKPQPLSRAVSRIFDQARLFAEVRGARPHQINANWTPPPPLRHHDDPRGRAARTDRERGDVGAERDFVVVAG